MSPHTVTTYKMALAKPLLWAFNIDLFTALLADFNGALQNISTFFYGALQNICTFFYGAFQNISTFKVPSPLEWNYDEMLLLMSNEFTNNLPSENFTMKATFLISLSTGGRISEVHSLHKVDSFLKFR